MQLQEGNRNQFRIGLLSDSRGCSNKGVGKMEASPTRRRCHLGVLLQSKEEKSDFPSLGTRMLSRWQCYEIFLLADPF